MTRVRIAFALMLPLVMAACDSPTGFIDAHELGVAAQQVESGAQEAAWLAQQLRERSVTAGMAWVHQQALAQDAAKALGTLARPVPPDLRDQQDTIAKAAAQLEAQVTRIAGAVNHPDELDALRAGFESLVKAMHPIGKQA